MKKIYILFSLLLLIFITSSCSKIKKHNCERVIAGDINTGSLYSELVDFFGEPNEKYFLSPDVNHNTYVWFDTNKGYDESLEIAKKEKVYYLAVVTNLNSSKVVYVQGKMHGYLTGNTNFKEIPLYV